MKIIRKERGLILVLISFVLIFLSFTGAAYEKRKSPLHITEICTKNKTLAYDDNGEYGADYIELYNDSDTAINIKGYGLSDDKDHLYKFQFEETVIEAHSAVLVWASENTDDTSLYRKDYVPIDIHGLPFFIAAGETLILTDAKGHTLDKVSLPNNIPENKVYASTLTHLNTFVVCDATPYSVLDLIRSDGLVENSSIAVPSFSVEGGWYQEPLEVSLAAPEGIIYYTVDGSEPDENSTLYTDPILVYDRSQEKNIYAGIDDISLRNSYVPDEPVDKGTVIKAIAVVNKKKSIVSSQTYFVGLDAYSGYENISVLEITVDPDDLFDYHNGIYRIGDVYNRYISKVNTALITVDRYIYSYANYAKEGRGWEREAKIEYLSASHQKIFEQNIGIRIHGGWSTAYNQKGFNLYARPEYDGNECFKYDFFDSSHNKLMLRTGGYRDEYVTKIRDVFNQSLVKDRSIGIQRFEPCNVFINGEYWGLYNLQETIGSGYVSEYYGVSEENILIMKNAETNTTEEDALLYTDIVDFAEKNDLSLEEKYRLLEEQIDIQSYIDYFCFEIYVANCDSVSNNFARWRSLNTGGDMYEDGRWRWLLYDTDESDGMLANLTSAETDTFVSGHWESSPLGENDDVLFSALMRNDRFKKQFVTTFMDMANYNFAYNKIRGELSDLSEIYKEAVIKSQQRFRGGYQISYYEEDIYTENYTEEVFDNDIAVIDRFFKDRYKYITAYMKQDLNLSGELSKVILSSNINDIAEIFLNSLVFTDFSGEWSGEYYTDYPLTLKCETPEGYRFSGWEVNGEIVSSNETVSITLDGGEMRIKAIVEKDNYKRK